MCNFGRGHYEEHFCEIILNSDQWFKKMLFKYISYLQIWQPDYLAELNHLCNFGRGHYEEYMCFELGPIVQEELLFKDISYLQLWQPNYLAEWNHLCNLRVPQ